MSSSVNSPKGGWAAAVALVAGIGAYTFPLVVPWHILFLLVAAVAGVPLAQSMARRAVWAALCVVILVAVLLGHLSSVFSAAIISACALAMWSAATLGVAVLALNMSVAMTMQEGIGEAMHHYGLEAAGPAIVAIAALVLARPRLAGHATFAAGLSVLAAWITNRMMLMPQASMALAALPACGFAVLVVRRDFPNEWGWQSLPLAAVMLIGLTSWTLTPPRSLNETYVLLPVAPNAVEGKFYRNYVQALNFAGITAKQIAQPEDVPHGALLLLPWLTSPFERQEDDSLTKRISTLARDRQWTVVVAGEHTDLGGVAARIRAITGASLLRNDLTVPPGNTDNSGPLHALDLRAWPHNAILNRGASVRLGSFADRVLLAGDGWWAEPNIGEWLWVGDYVWQPGDRAGRLALAVSTDFKGARWVVVGDNSLLINSQLIADPRPTIRLLEMSSLWPGFIRDVVLVVMASIICLPFRNAKWRLWSPLLPLLGLGAIAIQAASTSEKESAAWQDAYVGELGSDERNFNTTLAEHPELTSGRRLIRTKHPISGSVALPIGQSLIFTLVDGEAKLDGVTLSECHRIGSLPTSEGPYLMDAQACRVDGPVRVLLGTSDSAASFVVTYENTKAIVVLDSAFLSQRAPEGNAKWLLKQIQE